MKVWWNGLPGLVTGLVAALGVLGGPAAAQVPAPRKGGTAVLIMGSEPRMINAVLFTGSPDVLAACMVYEGLVVMNSKDQAEPALAESWTVSGDGTTYTFKLREAKFHDGAPFTSEDVRYTLGEVAAKVHPTFSAQVGKNLESVSTPDPRTVVFKLKTPYGPFLRTLSCAMSGGILPSHLFKGTEVATNPVSTSRPVGTGPFRFESWARGDNIAFARNPTYWDAGKPYLDRLVIKLIPNPGSRTQALLAGEADYISASQFPASSVRTIAANPRLKLERTGWSPNMLWAFFNLKRKPLDDVRVRNALLVATDRHYIDANAFAGTGKPGTAPWTVQIPWATDPAVNYDVSHAFDPEKAGRMLDEAGYLPKANGIRFKVGVTYDAAASETNQTALALQAMWRRAGVEVEPRPLEGAVLLPRVHKDMDFDVYLNSYTSYGDPAIGIARTYITDTIGRNYGNASTYSNPDVDALFAKAAELTTLEERGAVYRQIEHILMRDQPTITLEEIWGSDAASRKLHGAWGHYGYGLWGNAWLEQ